jgi:hypothetical protein
MFVFILTADQIDGSLEITPLLRNAQKGKQE